MPSSQNSWERDEGTANRLFSLFVYISILFGVIMTVLGIVLLRSICVLSGAEGQLLEDSLIYGRIFMLALSAWILLYEFQLFFVVAEKPKLGLYVTIASGVTNIVLDALFIIVFKWGIIGAAAASALSQVVGGVYPLIYFGNKNNSLLCLTKPILDAKAFLQCCSNGSSELMSGVAMSFVGILFNVQLLKYAGEGGVVAYGVMMYVSMIFSAVFMGYCNGSAPVISYHFGAQNHEELKSLLKKSLAILVTSSFAMFVLSEFSASLLASIFVSYDAALRAMTIEGFRIFAFVFLFMGFSIFGSSFFTALNNGLVSAGIAFLRTLVFEIGTVLLLPLIWDIDGIWASIVVAECIAMCLTILFLLVLRKRYRYF